MVDAEGNEMDSCPHPKQVFYVDLGMEMDEYDILRRAED
jgi:putative protease